VKQTTNATWKAARRHQLAVLVAAAGLAIAGCADNPPSAPATAPSPPAAATTLPAEPASPQPPTLSWARSACKTFQPAFDRLGQPPPLDLGNLAATRQAYIDYLTNARNATQQAIDRLPTVGPPPVDNGQQILENMRTQLIQLRNDLDEALTKLNQANPSDVGAVGLALGAAGNVVGALSNRVQMLGNLAIDPQLRAAINQTPECQNLLSTTTDQPASPPPPR
jgi:hypothetical protein